jgi:hypothetical protein
VKKSTPKAGRREEPEFEEEIRHDPGRPREISTVEMKNVVADTIERIYNEFGATNLNRASAEDFALFVVGYMKHGLWEGGTVDSLKLREVAMTIPLCDSCGDLGD